MLNQSEAVIDAIAAREILDSRGRPTVEAEVKIRNWCSRFSTSSQWCIYWYI